MRLSCRLTVGRPASGTHLVRAYFADRIRYHASNRRTLGRGPGLIRERGHYVDYTCLGKPHG